MNKIDLKDILQENLADDNQDYLSILGGRPIHDRYSCHRLEDIGNAGWNNDGYHTRQKEIRT